MPIPLPEPGDWTCAVCAATHVGPTVHCRRCGAAVLPFVRIASAARALTRAGLAAQAASLHEPGSTKDRSR